MYWYVVQFESRECAKQCFVNVLLLNLISLSIPGFLVEVWGWICNYLGIGEIEALVFHECAGHTIGSMIS